MEFLGPVLFWVIIALIVFAFIKGVRIVPQGYE